MPLASDSSAAAPRIRRTFWNWLALVNRPLEKVGLLGRMGLLIVILIGLAWGSGLYVVQTTREYVIGRELVDLSDETKIQRFEFEKGLNELHGKVVGNNGLLRDQPDEFYRRIVEHPGDHEGLQPPVIVTVREAGEAYASQKETKERTLLTQCASELKPWLNRLEGDELAHRRTLDKPPLASGAFRNGRCIRPKYSEKIWHTSLQRHARDSSARWSELSRKRN